MNTINENARFLAVHPNLSPSPTNAKRRYWAGLLFTYSDLQANIQLKEYLLEEVLTYCLRIAFQKLQNFIKIYIFLQINIFL